ATGPAEKNERTTSWLDTVIAEISREFGDAGHLTSNTAQARNLLAASGKEEGHFVEFVFQARSLTRERAAMHSAPSDGFSVPPLRTHMAFFYVPPRALLGPKPHAAPGPPSTTPERVASVPKRPVRAQALAQAPSA